MLKSVMNKKLELCLNISFPHVNASTKILVVVYRYNEFYVSCIASLYKCDSFLFG